uniref:Uncharacterized protein n=1 Tax=Moniliophthora roreri TaxID=221103 RepID=A0A0W0G880_MONRR
MAYLRRRFLAMIRTGSVTVRGSQIVLNNIYYWDIEVFEYF